MIDEFLEVLNFDRSFFKLHMLIHNCTNYLN